ncbi:MAG TPA: S-adenosylmethionine:tRNA ribosyltransferase-isomerase [Polyangiaceae bacterium]|nr:S-adenosylmethionine:tRNA ribosyltransferase-isomerase [Polyangiaceae bacterium]
MNAARSPRGGPLTDRLLVVDPSIDGYRARSIADLPDFVRSGDLLVVNDAATLPASLRGRTSRGETVEARLLTSSEDRWRAVLFGPGDWRTRTEDRAAPPAVREGDVIVFGALAAEALRARVVRIDRVSERLVELAFDAPPDRFWASLYRLGRPIQYAHVEAPLPLWHVQTPFASRPWSSEMPSAARPLAWELVLALRARGARFAWVTHAAGLSATGDPRIDRALPLRESFEVPASTAEAIAETRARGRRVLAVGTTVVRALESAALGGGTVTSERGRTRGGVLAGRGNTDLVIGEGHRLRVVDAILTGMHEPGTSHDALLHAFAPRALLAAAVRNAGEAGFLGHEFGDSMLVGEGMLAAYAERRAAGVVAMVSSTPIAPLARSAT